ncbi:MAG: hypothetical protein WC300_05195 [Candidatus Omnitrophota bacterium]
MRLDNQKYEAVLDDWQASLLLSYNCFFITPYAGARLSRTDYINWIDSDRKRHMSDGEKAIGLIYGVDIMITDEMWLNAKAGFFDAQTIAVSLMTKF